MIVYPRAISLYSFNFLILFESERGQRKEEKFEKFYSSIDISIVDVFLSTNTGVDDLSHFLVDNFIYQEKSICPNQNSYRSWEKVLPTISYGLKKRFSLFNLSRNFS